MSQHNTSRSKQQQISADWRQWAGVLRSPDISRRSSARSRPTSRPTTQSCSAGSPSKVLLSSSLLSKVNTPKSSSGIGKQLRQPRVTFGYAVVAGSERAVGGVSEGRQCTDYVAVTDNLFALRHQTLFAVFDGHGFEGRYVAEFAATTLPSTLREAAVVGPTLLSNDDNTEPLKEMMATAVGLLNHSLQHDSGIDVSYSGASFCAGVMRGSTLVLANLGTCRAVVGRRRLNWGSKGKPGFESLPTFPSVPPVIASSLRFSAGSRPLGSCATSDDGQPAALQETMPSTVNRTMQQTTQQNSEASNKRLAPSRSMPALSLLRQRWKQHQLSVGRAPHVDHALPPGLNLLNSVGALPSAGPCFHGQKQDDDPVRNLNLLSTAAGRSDDLPGSAGRRSHGGVGDTNRSGDTRGAGLMASRDDEWHAFHQQATNHDVLESSTSRGKERPRSPQATMAQRVSSSFHLIELAKRRRRHQARVAQEAVELGLVEQNSSDMSVDFHATDTDGPRSEFVPIPLSVDHFVDRPDERKRLIGSGARVEATGKPPMSTPANYSLGATASMDIIGQQRLFSQTGEGPGLAVSRCLGHSVGASLGVSHEPELTVHQIVPEDAFIILGTDGLWQVMTSAEAVDLAARIIQSLHWGGSAQADAASQGFKRSKAAVQTAARRRCERSAPPPPAEVPPKRQASHQLQQAGAMLSTGLFSLVGDAMGRARTLSWSAPLGDHATSTHALLSPDPEFQAQLPSLSAAFPPPKLHESLPGSEHNVIDTSDTKVAGMGGDTAMKELDGNGQLLDRLQPKCVREARLRRRRLTSLAAAEALADEATKRWSHRFAKLPRDDISVLVVLLDHATL